MSSICLPQVSQEHNILLIKTPNGNIILTKYFPNKTSVKNVIDTLKHRVEFSITEGGSNTRLEFADLSLSFHKKTMKDNMRDLSYYGIKNKIEQIDLHYKSKSNNSTSLNDYSYYYKNTDKILKDISYRNNIRHGSRRELQKWGKEKGKEYGVNGRSKSAVIRDAMINAGNICRQVFVKTLTGKTITLDIPQNATVVEMKTLIYHKEGIPHDQQRLVYAGNALEDLLKFEEYIYKNRGFLNRNDINATNFHEATLHLVLRLRGGMYSEKSGRNGNYRPLQKIGTIIYEIYSDNILYESDGDIESVNSNEEVIIIDTSSV